MVVRAGPWRRQNAKKLMPSNCNAGGLLKVPQTARISNQSILREINPEYSLEGLMLKLKLQYLVIWQLIGKVPDVGKDWGQKEKKVSEDEMAGWHHWRKENELGQTPGNGEGQGGLASCFPWCCKKSDMTGQLNNNNNNFFTGFFISHSFTQQIFRSTYKALYPIPGTTC